MVAEDVLRESGVEVREPTPADGLRPGEPDPAGAAEFVRHLTRVSVREEALAAPLGIRLELRADAFAERGRLLAERHLLGGEPKVHDRS